MIRTSTPRPRAIRSTWSIPIGTNASWIRTNNQIDLTLRITHTGLGATDANIDQVDQEINTDWTGSFGTYNVTIHVENGPDNTITIWSANPNDARPSVWNGHQGEW